MKPDPKTWWRRGGKPKPNDVCATPAAFYAMLDREFGFKLDAACMESNRRAPDGFAIDRGENGLAADWIHRTKGPVWCNPPYSSLDAWVTKCAFESIRGLTVVLLVPADPSTAWWKVIRGHASEIRFVDRRLRFNGETAFQSRTPSAVIVFDERGGPPIHTYTAPREEATATLPFEAKA